MSELMSEMDRAAAAYWRTVARLGAGDASAALAAAQTLVVEARAERRLDENGQAPTLNQIEAPPLGLW